MRRLFFAASLLLAFTSLGSFEPQRLYQSRNPDLGVVYRPSSIPWDAKQWKDIFNDPNPPMGWAVLPIGNESCSAITRSWLNSVKAKGLQPALLLDPFLSASTIKKTIDCAAPLGIKRAMLDEYVSYHWHNLKEPMCGILADVRSIYGYVKNKYPGFEFDLDDTWGTWMVALARGQSDSCGAYPYFQVDSAGISVLSKYGDPSQGTCGHPTASEMQEQLIDLKPTVRDYARAGKIFVWPLNRNWYPGDDEQVLQLYRQLKPVFGWNPFLLFGPTTTVALEDNWSYLGASPGRTCPPSNYNWYLPAREYLIRIQEGRATTLSLKGPIQTSTGVNSIFTGQLKAASGLSNAQVQFQIVPPEGSLQHFTTTVTAPSHAYLAFVGLHVNSKLPNDIRGAADFRLQRAQLFQKGSTKNLLPNSEFNSGLSSWVLLSSGSANVITDGSEKSLSVVASRNQSVVLSSLPIIVVPGRTYTVNFDAQVFQESRNNACFYLTWNDPSSVPAHTLFLRWPGRQTMATASTDATGHFAFSWQPSLHGNYSLFAFFAGTRGYQPSITSSRLLVK